MKKLLFVFLAAFLAAGFTCAGSTPLNPVCPPPQGQESWICEKSTDLNVSPEKVYGWIYSAAAIGAIADQVEIQEVCKFKHKIDKWYISVYPVSYDSAISKVLEEANLLKDPKKILLMKNIFNQNLEMYSSPELIDKYDDWMLRAGSNKFERDMLCSSVE